MKGEERAKKGNSIRGLSDFSFGTVELRVRFKYLKEGLIFKRCAYVQVKTKE